MIIELGNKRLCVIADFPPGEPSELKVWRDRQEFLTNQKEPPLHWRFLNVQAIDDMVVVLTRMRNAMASPKPGEMHTAGPE